MGPSQGIHYTEHNDSYEREIQKNSGFFVSVINKFETIKLDLSENF